MCFNDLVRCKKMEICVSVKRFFHDGVGVIQFHILCNEAELGGSGKAIGGGKGGFKCVLLEFNVAECF